MTGAGPTATSWCRSAGSPPRQTTSEEIADVIRLATSDQARFATFSEILADGGLVLGPVA